MKPNGKLHLKVWPFVSDKGRGKGLAWEDSMTGVWPGTLDGKRSFGIEFSKAGRRSYVILSRRGGVALSHLLAHLITEADKADLLEVLQVERKSKV
jgi:hypothetical protein